MTRTAATNRIAATHRVAVSSRLVRSLLLTLQPDAATARDTRLEKANPTTNFGTGTTFAAVGNGAANPVNGLFDWDLASLPAGSTVLSATMTLIVSGLHTSTRLFNAYEMTANSDWTEAGATWNTKDGTNAWAGGANGGGVEGTDISATAIGTATYVANAPVGTALPFSLTPSRVAANAGGRLRVLVKRIDAVTGAGPTFRLSDTSVAAERPMLVIRYVAGSGAGASGQEFLPTATALDTTTTNDTSLLNNPLSGPFGTKYTATGSSLPLSEQPLTTGNDRFYWNQFEVGGGAMPAGTTAGTYDWTALDAFIIANAANGRRVQFRVRAMDTSNDPGTYMPAYLATAPFAGQSADGGWVPDFNNTRFLDRAEAFIDALAAHVLTEPSIANMVWGVDVGMMGKFGEWADPTNLADLGFATIALASYTRIVQAFIDAFAGSPVKIILHSLKFDVTNAFLATAIANGTPLAFRSDGFGNAATSTQMGNGIWHPNYNAFNATLAPLWFAAWETFPMLGEPWTQYPDGTSASAYKQAPTDNGFDYFVAQVSGGEQPGQSFLAAHPEGLTRLLHAAAVANHNLISRNATDTAGANWPGSGAFAFTTEHQRQAYEAYKRCGYRYRISAVRVQDAVAGGTATIAVDWLNEGITPIYFAFAVTLQLWSGDTMLTSSAMATDLRDILPTSGTPDTETGSLSLAGVTAGTYTLRVIVTDADPRGARWPALKLAQSGRQVDGSYLIGSLVVVQ